MRWRPIRKLRVITGGIEGLNPLKLADNQLSMIASVHSTIGPRHSFTTLEWIRKAHTAKEQVLGRDHPHVGLCMSKAGLAMPEMGRSTRKMR